MMLKLTEHVGITIFLLYKQKKKKKKKKNGEILKFRTFIAQFWVFWIFAYVPQKIAIFRSGMFSWHHNYLTPWPIVLILVYMDRGDPYLPIDTKSISFQSVRKI